MLSKTYFDKIVNGQISAPTGVQVSFPKINKPPPARLFEVEIITKFPLAELSPHRRRHTRRYTARSVQQRRPTPRILRKGTHQNADNRRTSLATRGAKKMGQALLLPAGVRYLLHAQRETKR